MASSTDSITSFSSILPGKRSLSPLKLCISYNIKIRFYLLFSADRSFLDSLLPPPSRRSHSRSPSTCQVGEAAPRPSGAREEQVQVEKGSLLLRLKEFFQIFVKQLLTALAYMHSRGIVHLDLRPEVILLQDDHLRLADFGQSR